MTMGDILAAIGEDWVEVIDGYDPRTQTQWFRFFSALRPREAPHFLEVVYTKKDALLMGERLYEDLIRRAREAVRNLTSSSGASPAEPHVRYRA